MKKRTITILAAFTLLLLTQGNVNAQTVYGIYPWDGEDNVVSFNQNPDNTWEYSGIAGSTLVEYNYGIAWNPVDDNYYLIGGYVYEETRSMFRLNRTTFAVEDDITLLISSNGNTKPNAFTISSNGEFFIAYQNGRVDKFDVSTAQATAFADVPVADGAAGMTYDFDHDRLLFVFGSYPVRLYEITNEGNVNHLLDFYTPGERDDCTAQAIAYLGDGICLASSTSDCDILYSIDLDSETTELIAQPNGSPWASLKSFMFIPFRGDIHYVTETGAGDKDGSSWDDAFQGLQDALDSAEPGSQIWVAAGTYTATETYSGPKDANKSFQMKNGVAIYGGFAGNEVSLYERVIQDNPTILSGDLLGNDDYSEFPGDYLDDNANHVIYLPESLNLDPSAILDGFIIEGGFAPEISQTGSIGGGLYCDNNSPVIRNCIFRYNAAFYGGGAVAVGGDESVIKFVNCLLSNNYSFNDGGGMVMIWGANVTLINTTISENEAEYGGGIFAISSKGVFKNCIIWGNKADDGKQMFLIQGGKNGFKYILNNSCIANGVNDIGGVPNMIDFYDCTYDDPLFVDPENGDYRIFGNSPCVDLGNDAYNNLFYDIRGAGFDRKIANSKGEGIDMGAYEYNPLYDPYDPCTVNFGGEIGEDQDIPFNTQPELLYSITSPSGYYGTLEYKWQLSIVSPPVWTDIEITGTPTSTYQPEALTQTTWFRRLARVGCVTPTWEKAAASNTVKITTTGLPYPWEKCNTSPAANGTSSYDTEINSGTFFLSATGQSTTMNDVHHFVYQQVTSSQVTIIARLADVQNGGYAGVMIRKSCEPNVQAIYFKTLLYNPNVLIGYRTTAGKAMRNLSQVYQLIRWMKIQKNGNNYKVFISYNGTRWQLCYSGTINMGDNVIAGIFTESVRSNRISMARFDHVEVVSSLKTDDLSASIDPAHENTGEPDILILPNPADEKITILYPYTGKPVKLTVSNPEGRLVITEMIRESETQLNVQSLRPGIWFLRFESEERVEVKKLIIQ